MDPINQQIDEAKVEAIVQSRLSDKLKPIIIGLLVLYFISIPIFLYFYNPDHFNLPTPSSKSPGLIKNIQELNSVSQKLNLNCPVDNQFCNTKKDLTFDNGAAFTYQAASGSSVMTNLKIMGPNNIALLYNQQTGEKKFFESTLKDNSCYTVIYTIPSDAVFANILDVPINLVQRVIATLGSKLLDVDGQNVNVIVQVKQTAPDLSGTCDLSNQSPEFFQ